MKKEDWTLAIKKCCRGGLGLVLAPPANGVSPPRVVMATPIYTHTLVRIHIYSLAYSWFSLWTSPIDRGVLRPDETRPPPCPYFPARCPGGIGRLASPEARQRCLLFEWRVDVDGWSWMWQSATPAGAGGSRFSPLKLRRTRRVLSHPIPASESREEDAVWEGISLREGALDRNQYKTASMRSLSATPPGPFHVRPSAFTYAGEYTPGHGIYIPLPPPPIPELP